MHRVRWFSMDEPTSSSPSPRKTIWETCTFLVCRKGKDWGSHTCLATENWSEVCAFLWAKEVDSYRLYIRGREYQIHPNMSKMLDLLDYYMDLDAMYDDRGDFPYESS